MKKFFLAGSFIAAILLFNASVSNAQVVYIPAGSPIPSGGTNLGTPAQQAVVNTTIAQVLDLAVTTGQTVAINFPDIASLDNGVTVSNAVSLTFRSNLPWFVNVAANTPDFSGGDITTPMPSTILQYRLNGGTFAPLSTTASSVVGTTGAKIVRGAGTIGIDYRMDPGYVYGPGAYSLNLTYTISNK
jgi:hypothetical protein